VAVTIPVPLTRRLPTTVSFAFETSIVPIPTLPEVQIPTD